MVGELTVLFGLFSRQPAGKERLEDVSVTLRQKERELRELEHLLGKAKRQADSAIVLDERISQQKKILNDVQRQAEAKLREFKRAEEQFRARENKVLASGRVFQEQEAILGEKRRLLAEKEEALLQREDVVEERLERAKQLEDAIKRAEKPLEHRRQRIAGQIMAEERKVAELSQARAVAGQEIKQLRREIAHLESQSRELVAAGREFDKTRAAVERKAASISARERDVQQHEREVVQKTSKLQSQISAIEEAKRIIQGSMRIKADADRVIAEKRRYAEEAQRLLEENASKLAEIQKASAELASRQRKILTSSADVNRKFEEIERREKAVLKREMDWLDHQNILKAALEDLEKSKRELEDQVGQRKGELANLQQEWEERTSALSDGKGYLSAQKAELHRVVRADLAALKEKEQELLQTIKELNSDRQRLEREERTIVARVNKLEREERVVAQKEARLIQQEKTAKKILVAAEQAKKLKVDVPQLRKTAAQLRKEIAHLEKVGRRHGAIRRVMPAAPVVEREEIEAPAIEEPVRVSAKHHKIARPTGRDELQSMIEQARTSVQSGNVQEAVRLLDDLEAAARRLSEDDRRQLAYEIKDLRTSIKLAML